MNRAQNCAVLAAVLSAILYESRSKLRHFGRCVATETFRKPANLLAWDMVDMGLQI